MTVWQLPDGTTTTDYVSYFMAWEKFTAPLCERLGWNRLRSDHGCVFEIESGVAVSLPVSVVRQLRDIIAERDELMSLAKEYNDFVAERDELSRTPKPLHEVSECEECARLVDLLRHQSELTEFHQRRDSESRLSIEVFAREADENIARIDALTAAKDGALVELRLAQDAAKLAVSEYDDATRDLEREYQAKRASAAKEAKRLRAHLKYLIGCVNGVAGQIRAEDLEDEEDEDDE